MLRPFLLSPVGHLFYRPWVDKWTHKLLERSLFPASRCWAAVNGAAGDITEFEHYLRSCHPDNGQALLKYKSQLTGCFTEITQAGIEMRKARHQWEQLAFSKLDPDPEAVGSAEQVYLDKSRFWRQKALKFAPLIWFGRLKAPQVSFAIPTQEEVEHQYGTLRHHPDYAYQMTEAIPDLEVSHRGQMHHPDWGETGGHSYWLRFPSPGPRIQDHAWARVMEPAHGLCRGTLLIMQGIGQEADHMGRAIDPYIRLAAKGYRIIRHVAPWHGQRLAEGYYAGERMLAQAPMSALDFFGATVREMAYLCHWAHAQKDGPVGMIGISLGALTTQLALSHGQSWPKSTQADAALLIVPGTPMKDITLQGSLAEMVQLPTALRSHGWTDEVLDHLSPLTDPTSQAYLPAEKILLKLGRQDDVTGFQRGMDLARLWQIPTENIYSGTHGHYTGSNSLDKDPQPLEALIRTMHLA